MYSNDNFSQWLGIKVVEVGLGFCKLKMQIRKEMLNGFNILHGGVTFSLADTALAFASNTYGKMSVSIEASMNYLEQVKENQIITAIAEEASLTEKTGVYHITIYNQENKKIALLKGTVYRLNKEWEA
ncbi:MAG: hotdog fold thioesterase [Bacteroidetes bacterium]|nr:hotdog fold thioesterase [Bacteroidota bacterium]